MNIFNNDKFEIEVIDSHTGGEPTRFIAKGWPEIKGEDMESKRSYMQKNHDELRRAVICEPRGHDAIVGAVLTEPVNADSETGVIFFNDVGYLGMCAHAMIGVVETLRFLGRVSTGTVRLDTPAGVVTAEIDEDGTILIANVESYLLHKDVEIEVPGLGLISGDISWGGNWFFLTNNYHPELTMNNIDKLMADSKAIRQTLIDTGIRGDNREIVDHVEFFGPSEIADSKNFVLCPGNAYDRAPCGTGTSAKMVVMRARGKFGLDELWRQESITGSIYECYLSELEGTVRPFIRSKAFVTSKASLIFDKNDPFVKGI